MAVPDNTDLQSLDFPNSMRPAIKSGIPTVKMLCIFLAVISCLIYANTLYNGYVLDDGFMITENSYVKEGFNGIPKLLVTPHLKGYAPNLTDTYRPLSLVMFALEFQLWGLNPFVGHLVNILVFAGCVILLFIFLVNLFGEQRISVAFIASLLFAVHPIHTEVVANIKSRDELLCFFFAFLSLNIYLSYSRNGKLLSLICGTFCLFLSIISKETAFTFLGVIPLVFFFYENRDKTRSLYITGSAVLVGVIFIIIRTWVINKYKADGMIRIDLIDNALVGAPSMSARIATAILILGNYLKLLAIPYPLIADYSYNSIPYVGFTDIRVLLSIAIYLGLSVTAIYRLIRKREDLWTFGILLFLITLSLFTNIPFLFGATQADRLVFFSSAGTCLLMALAYEKWFLRSTDISRLLTGKAVVLFIVCSVYAIVTVARNTDWKDDYTLYKADVQKSPNNTRLNNFMGIELQKRYEDETDPEKKDQINKECIDYLKRALEIYPENSSAHEELGSAYLLSGEIDSSIVHFKSAIELDPKTLVAITNLGTLYSLQKKYALAVPYYSKTLLLDRHDTVTWFNLAICYLQIAKYDSSIFAFNKVLEIAPAYNNYAAYANIAAVYNKKGQADSARKYEAITKQYYPRFSLDSAAIK